MTTVSESELVCFCMFSKDTDKDEFFLFHLKALLDRFSRILSCKVKPLVNTALIMKTPEE